MRNYAPLADAAAESGYASHDQLLRLIRAGKVRGVTVGVLVDVDDLRRYLADTKPHMPRGGNSPRPNVPIPACRIFRGR